MKKLSRLALTVDLVALMTVVLGSWTRIKGAGLTCPDWPLCRGRLLPSLVDGTLWEWTHRLLAFAVAPLVIALIVAAWRKRDRCVFITPTLCVIGLLFLAQVFLGAETVRLANTPFSVVLHWATAMALIAALSAMAVFAAASEAMPNPACNEWRMPIGVALMLGVTALVAFLTMCIGAYVSSSGAGLACLSVPGCAGNIVVYTSGQYIQMFHRVAAGATLICAAGAFAVTFAHPASVRVRTSVAVGLGLVSLEVLLGLLNVAMRLPTNLREAHAVNAAFVFLAFFVAMLFAMLEAAPQRTMPWLTGSEAQR